MSVRSCTGEALPTVPRDESGDAPTGRPSAGCGWLTASGIALLVAGLVGLTLLQYYMPRSFESAWGLNYMGVRHFQMVLLGRTVAPLNLACFTALFRALFLCVWTGYAVAVVSGLKLGAPRFRAILLLGSAVALVLAVAWPLSFSCDCYAYVAYARMKLLHGLNPYLHSQRVLESYHDSAVPFLRWDIPSTYGPVWTQVSFAVVAMLRSAGLWWQVLAFKLIEAGALVVAALLGRGIANRFDKGKGDITFLAIGLNPLLLLEGPGNGHNDILMVCLVLAGAWLYLSRRFTESFVVVGLSIGMKFVTGALLPLMLVEQVAGKRLRESLLTITLAVVMALAPVVISFAPLWHGASTFTGIVQRWSWGHSSSAPGEHIKPRRWITPPEQSGQVSAASAVPKHLPLFISLAASCVWVWRRRAPGAWLTAWALLSWGIILLSTGSWYPWYLAWPWAASMVRWDRPSSNVSFMTCGIAIAVTMLYSVTVAPPSAGP